MAKTIGTTTTYDGDEHPYLRGQRVRVVGVMKGAAASDHDPDREGSYLRDEEHVVRAGAGTADDRVEAQPWLEREQRWSFVTSDARAIDLACFRHLSKNP
jgi:hypothetical protein